MKKFLFFLTFALVSSLFSDPIFKEKIHELIVDYVVNDIFLKNPELKTKTNLAFLKKIAEKYSEFSTNQEIDIRNVTNYFPADARKNLGLTTEQEKYVIERFVDIFEQWEKTFKEILIEHITSNKLQSLVEPTHIETVTTLITTKPNELEEVIYFLIQEETATLIKILIKTCNKMPPSSNKVPLGIAGIIGVGGILAILKYSGVLDNYIDNVALYILNHTDNDTIQNWAMHIVSDSKADSLLTDTQISNRVLYLAVERMTRAINVHST